jgi:hypothetical protein
VARGVDWGRAEVTSSIMTMWMVGFEGKVRPGDWESFVVVLEVENWFRRE